MAHDLSEYLSEFSSVGSVPTSLSGYGFGERTHQRELSALEASQSNPALAKPKSTASGNISVQTLSVQSILVGLGYPATGLADGKFGKTTKATWEDAARKRPAVPSNPYINGSAGAKTVEVNASTYQVLADISRATQQNAAATGKPVAKLSSAVKPAVKKTTPAVATPAAQVSKPAAVKVQAAPPATAPAAPAPLAKGDLVANTRDVQLLLKRLGWTDSALKNTFGAKAGSLDDGKVGRVTEEAWKQSSNKRKLNPSIVKASADGTQVKVKETTYLQLKAVADAMSPPTSAGPGAQPVAASPSQQAVLDKKIAEIVKASTSRVLVTTLRQALDALIASNKLQHAVIPETGAWEDMLATMMVDALNAKPEDRGFLLAALVPGKLVSKDGKYVSFPLHVASNIEALAKSYKAAEKAAEKSLTGYTKVNTAEIIGKINDLSISAKLFNRNGGAKEMADAIVTFFQNTKTSQPNGEMVVVIKGDTYTKNEALTALANAIQDAETRAAATRNYRANMVANALKDSSATVPLLQVQQAVAETVRSGKAGANKALYSKVKQTGAFDTATRDAYTSIAQTLTIGAAVLEAERLLKAQMGPRYNVALTQELRNKVWGEFLAQAVQGNQIKTMPVIAQLVAPAAQIYSQTPAGQNAPQEVAQAQNTALTDAVNKSTRVISLLDAQQALLQMVANKEIDPVSGLNITGRSDKPTRDALFWISGMIFPEGYKMAETTWAAYLNAVGLNVVSDTNVTKGWNNANYIALPVAAADLLLKRAGEYVFGHGPSAVQVARYSQASTVSVPAAVAAPTAAEPPTASAPAAVGPSPAAAPTPTQAAAPSPMPGPAPQAVDFTQDAQAQQPIGPTAPAAPAPAADATSAAPAADAAAAALAPAADSGNGMLWLLGGAAALAALVAFSGDKTSADKTGAKNTQTRYAHR